MHEDISSLSTSSGLALYPAVLFVPSVLAFVPPAAAAVYMAACQLRVYPTTWDVFSVCTAVFVPLSARPRQAGLCLLYWIGYGIDTSSATLFFRRPCRRDRSGVVRA